jgi:hypothetical protein
MYPRPITQAHLDDIAAQIDKLKMDKDNSWPDIVAIKSAEGAIIRLQAVLEEMTRLYEEQQQVTV